MQRVTICTNNAKSIILKREIQISIYVLKYDISSALYILYHYKFVITKECSIVGLFLVLTYWHYNSTVLGLKGSEDEQ